MSAEYFNGNVPISVCFAFASKVGEPTQLRARDLIEARLAEFLNALNDKFVLLQGVSTRKIKHMIVKFHKVRFNALEKCTDIVGVEIDKRDNMLKRLCVYEKHKHQNIINLGCAQVY